MTNATPDPTPLRNTIRRKVGGFDEFMHRAEMTHWRTLACTIKLRDRLYGGKPRGLKAEEAMIKARGLEDVLEAIKANVTDPAERAALAETVKDEGICEFYRREGKPGIWMPSHQFKAMIKENGSCLGYYMDATPKIGKDAPAATKKRLEKLKEAGAETPKKTDPVPIEEKGKRGLKGTLHECVFAYGPDYADREWIYLGEKPTDIATAVCHTNAKGQPQTAIKRNEFVVGLEITFIIQIARAQQHKIPDETLFDILYHGTHHGVGANRSQGYGTFELLNLEEVEGWGTTPA